jgi:hypothetical protein
MLYALNSQGTAVKAPPVPPIPQMDVSAPPPASAGDLARQAAATAREARAAARDAQKAGTPDPGHIATTAPPFGYDANNVIPPQAVDIATGFFVTLAVCVVGFPLARAFARRIDRKTEFKSVPGPDLTPHIRQLQDSVDAMAIELERISEGQRFTTKMLAERSGISQK